MIKKPQKKLCPQGHTYFKSSDCPVCPICENNQKKPEDPFAVLGAPARRALQNAGISGLNQLTAYTEAEILKWHGMGPSSVPRLRALMDGKGLQFRDV